MANRKCFTTLCAVLTLGNAQTPPPTRIEDVVDVMHEVKVVDPYRWLEDQQSPETRAWITAQNVHTQNILDAVPQREHLRQAAQDPSGTSPSSVRFRKGQYFYERMATSSGLPEIVVRNGPNGPERKLLASSDLGNDSAIAPAVSAISENGKLLAFAKRRGGSGEFALGFLDVDTGKIWQENLPVAGYSDVFLFPDHSGLLYIVRKTGVGSKIMEHKFGSPLVADVERFGAGFTAANSMRAQYSADGRYIAVFSGAGAFLVDRQSSEKPLALRAQGISPTQGVFGGNTLFIRTSSGAPNGRLFAIDLKQPAFENWREVVPHSPTDVMNWVLASAGKLLVTYRSNALSKLKIFEPSGKLLREIALPDMGSAYFFPVVPWEANEIFFGFSSITQPFSLYRHELSSGVSKPWPKPQVNSIDSAIETKQVWYHSKDGTRVPMFLVSGKNWTKDGKRPTLLTAYGGYGSIQSPDHRRLAEVWVKNGGIFALASIRGGGEFGESWHKEGMLANKQNSFDDFYAAAEWLIANNFTTPSKLAIEGASNGGMLVAVAAVQRPDLFRAVVSRNGHFDMLRYHKFLYAANWIKEYGNPDVASDFYYLSKYSPYHQLKAGVKYPAMLFITGDGDTVVAPLHARKMTARMQNLSKSGPPILLRYDLLAGHSGSVSAQGIQAETADTLAFLSSQLGWTLSK